MDQDNKIDEELSFAKRNSALYGYATKVYLPTGIVNKAKCSGVLAVLPFYSHGVK
ncbi:MAG: hypothetical protein ACI8R9_000556 [Paraglaciecola sp.]|jgi:hypothetical protein